MTRADLKHCGKIPDAREDLNRSVREGRIESRHSIKSLEGMGSSSYDLGAELRMHSFTVNCDTFSNEEKVAAVELNPGSTTPNQSSSLSTNYPCGICQKKVINSHHALLCNKCVLWFHNDCLKFPVSNYSTLIKLTSFSWVCTDCGYSNYSHGTPRLNPILSYANSYSILSNYSDYDNDLPKNGFFTSTLAKNKTNINKTPLFL